MGMLTRVMMFVPFLTSEVALLEVAFEVAMDADRKATLADSRLQVDVDFESGFENG